MIEEAIIVVLLLQRNDFLLDERVDLGQQILDVLRNCEVHGAISGIIFANLALSPAEGASGDVFALQQGR
jgi:hypothetical protein